MKFKAAMFDFDGTITEKGAVSPSQEMVDQLFALSQKMPIAFCTGRQLNSFVKRGLIKFSDQPDLNARHKFFENLYLMAENGSVGYFFDTDFNGFEEFYRASWPDNFIEKEELITKLDEVIKGFGEVYKDDTDDGHKVVIVIRTSLYGTGQIDEIYGLSEKIYNKCYAFLKSISPDFEKYLHIGNSGIGVVICPADGDKDTGIKKFVEFLNKNKGFEIDKFAREVLVVGDQPTFSGNDHYFLKGELGTPYTVGYFDQNIEFPKPVLDINGKRLLNSKGTIYLIKSVLDNHP